MKQFATVIIPVVITALFVFHIGAADQQTSAKVLSVASDGSGNFPTIQQALKNAPEGATIRIGKGTWNVSNEPLEITRPVTLEGEGWEATRIVFAIDDSKRPSPEKFEVLERVLSELDAETKAKVMQAAMKIYLGSPVLTVKSTKSVVVRNLTFQRSEPVQKGGARSDVAVEVLDSEVFIEGCAIVESPGTGLAVRGASHVKVSKCLVANSWDKGVLAAVAEDGSFEITDSEIRNNRYSGISLGGSSKNIRVQRCRIHSTGWHGIRYDGGSPVIESNVFHRTAVSGIYASGRTQATVANNLFHHSGISCWYQNADTIESNTFVGDRLSQVKGGISQGMQVLGKSQPTIRHNLFVNCEDAVIVGDISSEGPYSKSNGDVTLIENGFWNNLRHVARNSAEGKLALPVPDGNLEQQPKFIEESNQDFRLEASSPFAQAKIGAKDFVALPGPWPLQPEENRTIAEVEERLAQTRGQR